jgi:hypothetical protein
MPTVTLRISASILNENTGVNTPLPNFQMTDGTTYVVNFVGPFDGEPVTTITLVDVDLYIGGVSQGNQLSVYEKWSKTGPLQYTYTASLADFDYGAGVLSCNFEAPFGRGDVGPNPIDFTCVAGFPPPTLTLNVDNENIEVTQSSNLSATYTSNGVAQNVTGSVQWNSPNYSNSSSVFTPAGPGSYVFSVSYNGVTSNQVTVNVAAGPANLTINASPSTITTSQYSVLTAQYNGTDVTSSTSFYGVGITYGGTVTFSEGTAGSYQITASYDNAYETVYASTNVTVVGAPINVPQAQGCPNANFVVTGDFFDGTTTVYVNGVFCPTEVAPTSNSITCFLPNGAWAFGQTYSMTVTNQYGNANSSFLVPMSCAPPPPPAMGTLTVYADNTNILTTGGSDYTGEHNSTNIHVSYTDASGTVDVTNSVTFSGSAAGDLTGNNFSTPTPGSFTLSATYVYYNGYYGTFSASSNTVSIAATIPVPVPVLNAITTGCPGSIQTITGKYFPSDITAYIVQTNQVLSVIAGTLTTTNDVDYQFNVALPNTLSNVSGTAYTIYVTGHTGTSNTATLTIPNACGLVTAAPTLVITGPASVCAGSQTQYTATYVSQTISGNAVVNSIVDVTKTATWTSSTFGEATLNQGLYAAPFTTGTYTITVASNGLTNSLSVIVQNCAVSIPAPTSCQEVLVSPSNELIYCGTTFQFTAYYNDGEGDINAITPLWLVNEIPGGNSQIGTISVSGVYTAPITMPPFLHVKISAIQGELEGYSVIALYQPVVTTPACNITVGSQINVFFGDGRHGYIPAGTTISLQPGQYWIATYDETLGTDLVAVDTGDQAMLSFAYYAQSNTASVAVYNQGQLVSLADGTFTRTYSVVLGLCDPVTGIFGSAWDIIPSTYAIDNDYPLQPPCGHGMSISNEKSMSIEAYAQTKLKKHKPVEIRGQVQRGSANWTGAISYNNGKVKISDALKLYYFNPDTKAFELKFVSGTSSYDISEGQSLLALPTAAGGWEFSVISTNDNLFDSSHTYVLGTVVNGQFYSEWPIVKPQRKEVSKNVWEIPRPYASILSKIQKVKNASST